MKVEGRLVGPDGKVLAGSRFATNIAAHRWILEHEVLRRHARGEAGDVRERHVNWVVDALREESAAIG